MTYLLNKHCATVGWILTGRNLFWAPSGVNLRGWGNPGDTALLAELWSREGRREREIEKEKERKIERQTDSFIYSFIHPSILSCHACVAYCGRTEVPCGTGYVVEACAPHWVWQRVTVGGGVGCTSLGWWKDWWVVGHTVEEAAKQMTTSEKGRSGKD